MRANNEEPNPNMKIFIVLVLSTLFITSCSPISEDPQIPDAQFDPMGTAQAQVSDLDDSLPPQEIIQELEEWLLMNSTEILSPDSADYSDLQFLKPLLEGKRIVQLGEDDHLTSEQSTMKVRLIQYLHQELGYEVIAFESSLLDCYLANNRIPDLSPTDIMDQIFFGEIWHTEEVLPLFEYINETSSLPSPLILTGFDIFSLGEGLEDGTLFYYSLLEGLDDRYASEVRDLDEIFKSNSSFEEFADRIDTTIGYQESIQAYEKLAEYINQNQQALRQENPAIPGLIEVAEQFAWSRARSIEALYNRTSSDDYGESLKARDSAMAANIEFLTDELYPDQKIIIWAHNGHIAKKSPWISSGVDNMGTYLVQYYDEEIYTIGLIGHRSADSYWSLENQLHLYGKPYLFFDLSPEGTGNDTSSTPTQILTVSEEYDALIYLDKITPHNPLVNTE